MEMTKEVKIITKDVTNEETVDTYIEAISNASEEVIKCMTQMQHALIIMQSIVHGDSNETVN